MGTLPTNEQLTGSEISTSEFKSAIGNLRDYVNQIIGGGEQETAIIYNGKISPFSAYVSVGLESQDNSLSIISLTNYSEGQIIVLTSDNDIVIKHNDTGTGSIYLNREKDVVINSSNNIIVIRKGSLWKQISLDGYLFDSDDKIKTDYLGEASQTSTGIIKLASDEEYEKSSSLYPALPSQIKRELEAFKVEISNLVLQNSVQVGTIIIGSSTQAPNGYLFCDGKAVSRTDYPELFALIGITFGSGDGSTTFNVPKLSDNRYLMGSTSVGSYIGESLPNIKGSFNPGGHFISGNGSFYTGSDRTGSNNGSASDSRIVYLDASRSSSAYKNGAKVRPDSLSVMFYIKY